MERILIVIVIFSAVLGALCYLEGYTFGRYKERIENLEEKVRDYKSKGL